MRVMVACAAAVAAAALIAVAVAARGSDRSACGEVGDRERAASPRGRVAFIRCTAEGSAWLYVGEGAAARRLVPSSYGCCYRPSAHVVFRSPAWSPDGRRLAVLIADTGGTDVWVIGLASRRARRLTSGPAVEHSLRWSPDGRRVSFATETGARRSARAAPR